MIVQTNTKQPLFSLSPSITSTMSAHDNEELVAYEDDEELVATGNASAQNGAVEKDKKYAGIHSTGFRCANLSILLHILRFSFVKSDFLLKPELLRAISDLGFEHPSEGVQLD